MIRRLYCLDTYDTEPFRNLAVERYLTLHAGPGDCILYLWQNRDTVVIGRNQNAWKECRVSLLEAEGGQLARRASGGGAVFHDLGNLNFSFAVRKEDYSVPRQLSVLAEACRSLGIDASVSGRNDVTANGRKFSGNAFYEHRGACCHHGTILIGSDTARLERYLNVSREKLKANSVASVRARVGNLSALCPDLTPERMRTALKQAFAAVYALAVTPLAEQTLDRAQLDALTARFADPTWRYGRCASFTHSFSRRFPWGEAEFCFSVKDGHIQDCALYSDALEPSLCPRLADDLRGAPFSAEAVCRAVPQGICGKIYKDLIAFIQESL